MARSRNCLVCTLAIVCAASALLLATVATSANGAKPGWKQAGDITPAGQWAEEPQVAGASGKWTAVWQRRNDDATYAIQTSTRPTGGSWSTSVDLGGGTTPRLGVDSSGSALAAWTKDTNSVVQASAQSADGTWSPPVDLSSAGKESRLIDVAVDSGGGATAVWRTKLGSKKYALYAASRPAAGKWGKQVRLFSGPTSFGRSAVAAGPRGSAIVAWVVQGKLQIASRAGRGKFRVRTIRARNVVGDSAPDVSIGSNGSAVLAWAEFSARGEDETSDIMVSTSSLTGSWSRARDITNYGKCDDDPEDEFGCRGYDPRVAVGTPGTAVIGWGFGLETPFGEGEDYYLAASLRRASGNWPVIGRRSLGGRDVLLDSPLFPELAINKRNHFVVGWVDNEAVALLAGSKAGFKRKSFGCGVCDGERISVSVAIDSSGDALAVWPLTDRNDSPGDPSPGTQSIVRSAAFE